MSSKVIPDHSSFQAAAVYPGQIVPAGLNMAKARSNIDIVKSMKRIILLVTPKGWEP
jgi:hypothetical protein